MVRLFTIVFTLCLIAACDSRQPKIEPNGEAVSIVFMAPLRGEEDLKGKYGLSGLRQFFKDSPMLPDGTRIQVVAEHVPDDGKVAAEIFQRVVALNDLAAIVSFNDSDTLLAIKEDMAASGVPILAGVASHPDITPSTTNISQLIFNDRFQGAVAALYVRDEKLFDSAAVVTNSKNAYSSFLGGEFAATFARVGGKASTYHYPSLGADSLATLVDTIVSEQPDIVYMPLVAERVVGLSELLAAKGSTAKVMVGDGIIPYLLNRYSDRLDNLEGMLSADIYSPGMPLTRLGGHYVSSKKGYLKKLNSYSILGIESGLLLQGALKNCLTEELKLQCINSQLRQTEFVAGVTGMISIDENGHASRPLVISELHDGEPVFRVQVY